MVPFDPFDDVQPRHEAHELRVAPEGVGAARADAGLETNSDVVVKFLHIGVEAHPKVVFSPVGVQDQLHGFVQVLLAEGVHSVLSLVALHALITSFYIDYRSLVYR